jgi:hypothetical protein
MCHASVGVPRLQAEATTNKRSIPMITKKIKSISTANETAEILGDNSPTEGLRKLIEDVPDLRSIKRYWLGGTIVLEVADTHKTLAQRSLELTDSLNIAMVQRSWLGHANEITEGLSRMSEKMNIAEHILRAN